MSAASLLSDTPARLQTNYFPSGAGGTFYSTTTQVVLGANTATPITYNQSGIASGCVIDALNPSRIITDTTGVYKVSFSIQLDKSGAGVSVCNIWIAKNGIAVPASGCRVSVNGTNGESLPFCEYILPLANNDYVEVYISSPDTTMAATYFAAAAPVPEIPSIITNLILFSVD